MSVSVKERPILFSAPMVRALLAGAKTQTRRVVKLLHYVTPDTVTLSRLQPGYPDGPRPVWDDGDDPNAFSTRNPYGGPGDRLWVRETWTAWATVGAGDHVRVEYRDGTTRDLCLADWSVPRRVQAGGWSPSIFMPRWACRITLEITDVRVERVQDISIDDVLAEGVERDDDEASGGQYWREHTGERFAALWDEINAKRGHGWDVNPWVWVIAFRVVTP